VKRPGHPGWRVEEERVDERRKYLTPDASHFEGCLVGQALGDALGFVVEGQPPAVCGRYVEEHLQRGRLPRWGRGSFPVGEYSDDTQLARELLRSYAEKETFDPSDYARRIARMFSEGEIVGRGRATEQAAERLAAGVPWREAGTPPPSAGNGSAMRAGPVGLVFSNNPEGLVSAAVEQGFITHRDDRCSAGAVAIAAAVALAATGPVERLDFLGRIAQLVRPIEATFADLVMELSTWSAMPPAQAARHIAPAGLPPRHLHVAGDWDEITPFVVPSVLWALYCFLRSSEDYWQTICTAIAVGGDVDTTAAMAGAISGAHLGIGTVPEKFAGKLTDRGSWGHQELRQLAGECREICHFFASPDRGDRER
jgi:ADP-ribosylglycohydrolase